METFTDIDIWLQKAGALLASNRIYVDGHSYTAPSLDTIDFGRKDYANQYLWELVFPRDHLALDRSAKGPGGTAELGLAPGRERARMQG